MHSIYQGIWHIPKQRILCNFFKLTDKFEKLHFTGVFQDCPASQCAPGSVPRRARRPLRHLRRKENQLRWGFVCVCVGGRTGARPLAGQTSARACLCRGARAPAWPARGARTRSWPARSAHARVPGRPLERARMPGRARRERARMPGRACRGTTGRARSARAWVRVEGRVRCGRAHAAARGRPRLQRRELSHR